MTWARAGLWDLRRSAEGSCRFRLGGGYLGEPIEGVGLGLPGVGPLTCYQFVKPESWQQQSRHVVECLSSSRLFTSAGFQTETLCLTSKIWGSSFGVRV